MSVFPSNSNVTGLPSAVGIRDNSAASFDNTQNGTARMATPTMLNGPDSHNLVDGTAQIKLEELRALLGGQLLNVSGDDAVVNQRGAPALYRPASSRSVADLSIMMTRLVLESSEGNKDVVENNLRAEAGKLEKNAAFRIANQKEIRGKTIEQAEYAHTEKVSGWVAKIAAVIAATIAVAVTGVATFFSGGATLPLLAISTMALVTASMSLADQVSRELDGPEISLSNLISSTSVSLLEAFGVDHEKAVRIGQKMVGYTALALPVLMLIEPQMAGTLAQNICESAGVSPETAQIVGMVVSMVTSLAVGVIAVGVAVLGSGGLAAVPIAMRVIGGVISGGATLVQGGAMIEQGRMKINTTISVNEVSHIQASNVELEASSLSLRKQMDTDQETIKTLMKNIEDGMRAAAQIIKELFDSLSQISSNISRRASV